LIIVLFALPVYFLKVSTNINEAVNKYLNMILRKVKGK
jgi:hypothetical protein